jgi:hypothetical protein
MTYNVVSSSPKGGASWEKRGNIAKRKKKAGRKKYFTEMIFLL